MNPIIDPMYEYIFFDDKELCEASLGAARGIEMLFDNHFDLLRMRKDKLKDHSLDSLTYATYFDMILIQLRALFLLKPSKNDNYYDVHNYLSKTIESKGLQEIDQFFANDINYTNDPDNETEPLALGEAIRRVVNRRIAHNEKMSTDKIFLIDEIQRILLTPTHKHYICTIVEDIDDIIERNKNQHYWDEVQRAKATSNLDPNKRYRFEFSFSEEK